MRAQVAARFWAFSEYFEGLVDWLYLDVKRLVSIGVGLLFDPLPASSVAFVVDGRPATQAEVAAAWSIVKRSTLDPKKGGGQYATLTRVRATRVSLEAFEARKLLSTEASLKTYFPTWDTWCCDAQLAVLSMGWAFGEHFPQTWPHFTAACNAGDWNEAARQAVPSASEMSKQNDSFHKRIAANVKHLLAAAACTSNGSSPDDFLAPLF